MSTYTFKWPKGPKEVILTGSFDNWSKSLPLVKQADGSFELTVPLPAETEKVLYKYVVDGDWVTSSSEKITKDDSGIENNFLEGSDLVSAKATGAAIPEAGGLAAAIKSNDVKTTVMPKEESKQTTLGEAGIHVPQDPEALKAFETVRDVDPKTLNEPEDTAAGLSAAEKKKQKKKVKRSQYKAKKKKKAAETGQAGAAGTAASGVTEESTEDSPEPDSVEESKEAEDDDAGVGAVGVGAGAAAAAAAAAGVSAAVSEPKVEEPKVEEPKVEEPKVEEPKVEEPKVEEPKVEEPKVEEPKVEVPEVKEPVITEPKVEEPVIAEPKVEEPVIAEPKVEEPVVKEPVVSEPVVSEPVASEPVVEPKEEPADAAYHSLDPNSEGQELPVEKPVETSNYKSDDEIVVAQGDGKNLEAQILAAENGEVTLEEIQPTESEKAKLTEEANMSKPSSKPSEKSIKEPSKSPKKEEKKPVQKKEEKKDPKKKKGFLGKLKKIFS